VASKSGNQDIARRYATAFFDLAAEAGQVDTVAADMQVLQNLVASGGDFARFVDDATLRRDEQSKALLAIAKQLKLSALTEKLLGTLALRRRLPVLADVVSSVVDMIARHKGEVTAEVTSAAALDQSQLNDIAQHLQKITGSSVKVKLDVDPAIMGGLIIRVGSRLMDASVRTKLERMHRSLKNTNELTAQKKMKEVA
jgi:F-type H+-transporting ATPase subunit delta